MLANEAVAKKYKPSTNPHVLALIHNAPPLANAYIDSSLYSKNVEYLKINALQLFENFLQYPVHFFNENLMDKNQQIIEEYYGVSEGSRYHFYKLQEPENQSDQSDDTNYRLTFIGEVLESLYPNFLPHLFRTKPFTPTKNHPKLTNTQQMLIKLLPSKMYSSRPQSAYDELEINLDNALYDHPLFNKHEGTRTYDLFVDGNPNGLELYLQNPDSLTEIQEAQVFLDEIRTAYSCMFVDKSRHADEITYFVDEIINHRKDIKIEEITPIEINGVEHKCSLLSFYDIDLKFKFFSKNYNDSLQAAAILAYIYLLIKELRPKCYKNT